MDIDASLRKAIRDAVQVRGQPAAVADKLIGWLTELRRGNESIENRVSAHTWLEGLCDQVRTDLSEGGR